MSQIIEIEGVLIFITWLMTANVVSLHISDDPSLRKCSFGRQSGRELVARTCEFMLAWAAMASTTYGQESRCLRAHTCARDASTG